MKISTLILAGALFAGLATSAYAAGDDVLDGSNVDEILSLASSHGNADLQKQDNGDPKIKGDMNGVSYSIYFMNCTDNKDCEDLNFYSGFLNVKPSTETINKWNQEKRFGKAYLDEDGDAVVEMDINLEHGITSDNMDADLDVWGIVLDQYTDEIGYKKDDDK
ncbi:MAG TPA: YbjN domain-containing protein [Devosiaceae bacterium]|jgi:hypothetical protein